VPRGTRHLTTPQAVHSVDYKSSDKNVERNNDYSVQNDESLRGHCTNERRIGKQDKKVRRDVI